MDICLICADAIVAAVLSSVLSVHTPLEHERQSLFGSRWARILH